MLQSLDVSENNFTGTLPTVLASLEQLQELTLSTNLFSGELPAAWGDPRAFKQLTYLEFSSVDVTGGLPAAWGSPHGFQKLGVLYCEDSVKLGGTLPESWASPGAFPNVQEMILYNSSIGGTIPTSWGFPGAFPKLQRLNLGSSSLQGSIPAFNNTASAGLDLDSCRLNGSLGMFWSSSAPLQAASLSGNHISGSLPDLPGALSGLTLLDLGDNQMTGTLPLSWLQQGDLLSHVSVLNVGDVWQRSVDLTAWRQQLCLQTNLYDLDVTGQQAKLLPDERQSWEVYENNSDATEGNVSVWLQDAMGLSEWTLGYLVQTTNNQLTSVKDICANDDSSHVLLIVWLVFGGSCLFVLGIYACLQRYKKHVSVHPVLWRHLLRVCEAVEALYEVCYGLGGLAFYYYDLITSIIVLAQVWGKWPASALMAIFLVHFALTGVIVAFHGVYKLFDLQYDLSETGLRLSFLVVTLSLLCGPLMIPIVLLLDTCTFIRQVFLFPKRVVGLPGFQWLHSGFAVASRLHRCLNSINYVGLSWVDLENYEGMHNLIAACLQSLPTVILNSVLFSLGNNPSHGIFLSSNLFVAAIVASFLAMLKTLMEVLWQASRRDVHPMRHAASLVVGKTLAGDATQSKLGARSRSVELLTLQYLETAPLGDPAQRSRSLRQQLSYSLSLSNPRYSYHATADNTSTSSEI